MIDWRPECTKQSWGTDAGYFTGGPTKIVLHSTETIGFPGYNNGQSAPHETWWFDPAINRFYKKQHIPHTLAARALVNLSGGVQTNRDGAHQVEIVGYCDKVKSDAVGGRYLPDQGDVFLKQLGLEIRELAKDIGCSTVLTSHAWIRYVGGPDLGQRMSQAEWDGFAGICGHEHVPENDHQDPGNTNIARAMLLSAPVAPPAMEWTRSDVSDFQGILEVAKDGKWGPNTDTKATAYRCVASPLLGQTDEQERIVQAIVDVTVDGIIGTKTRAAMVGVTKSIQKILHVSQDGIWGSNTDAHFLRFRKEWYGRY